MFEARYHVLLLITAISLSTCIAARAADNSPVNLDLSSPDKSISAGLVLSNGSSASITQAGTPLTVTADDKVTAAQYAALTQVLGGNPQSIILSSSGAASGGTWQVSPALSGHIANLSVPAGLTVLQNADNLSNLNISGNLTNSGVYQFLGSSQVLSPSLQAQNIVNYGLITSQLTGSLSANANLSASLGFQLVANNNITNYGTISSAGQLSMIAGGSITNAGLSSVIQSMQNLNLYSAAGSIVNQGAIAALGGNLSVNSSNLASIVSSLTGVLPSQDLKVVNDGLLQAATAINVRDSLFSGTGSLIISGGSLAAQEINLFSGCGEIHLDSQVSGELNLQAGSATITTSSPQLTLGSINLSGDPVFANFSGDIALNTDLYFPGQPLTIVASRNIYSTTGATKIVAGELNIVAGARGGSGPQSPCIGCPIQTITNIYGASVSGGSIDLTGGNISIVQGDSQLVLQAFAGALGDSGQVKLNPTTLMVSSGNIYVSADKSVQLGDVNRTGAAGSTVQLSTGLPFMTAFGNYPYIVDGHWYSAPFSYANVGAGDLKVGKIVSNSSVTLIGGNVLVGGINLQNAPLSISINASSEQPFILGSRATNNGLLGNLFAGSGDQQIYTYSGSGYTVTTKNMGGSIRINTGGDVVFGSDAKLQFAGNDVLGSLSVTAAHNISFQGITLLSGPVYLEARNVIDLGGANLSVGKFASTPFNSSQIYMVAYKDLVNSSASAAKLSAVDINLNAYEPSVSLTLGNGSHGISTTVDNSLQIYAPNVDIVADLSLVGNVQSASFNGKNVSVTGTASLNSLYVRAHSPNNFSYGVSANCANCVGNNITVNGGSLVIDVGGDLQVNGTFSGQILVLSAGKSLYLNTSNSVFNGTYVSLGAHDLLQIQNMTALGASSGLEISAGTISVGAPLNLTFGDYVRLSLSNSTLNFGDGKIIGSISSSKANPSSATISAANLIVPSGYLDPLNVRNLSLTGQSLLQVGSLSGNFVSFTSEQVQSLNLSQVHVSGGLTVTSKGDVVLPSILNGSLNVNSGGSVWMPLTVMADGAMAQYSYHSYSPVADYKYTTYGEPGKNVTVNAAGTVYFTGPSLISSNGSNGGDILIHAALIDTAGNNVHIRANGFISGGSRSDGVYDSNYQPAIGVGGQIDIKTSDSAGDITVGSTGFTLESRFDNSCVGCPSTSTQGYYAATHDSGVFLSAGRDTKVDTTHLFSELEISLSAARNLQITGDISVPVRYANQFGTVNLHSGNTAVPFIIGGSAGCSNCIIGSLIGASGNQGYFYSAPDSHGIRVDVAGDLRIHAGSLNALYSPVQLVSGQKIIAENGIISTGAGSTDTLILRATSIESATAGPVRIITPQWVSIEVQSSVVISNVQNSISVDAPSLYLNAKGDVTVNSAGTHLGDLAISTSGRAKIVIDPLHPIPSIAVYGFDDSIAGQTTFSLGGTFSGSGISGDLHSLNQLSISRDQGFRLTLNSPPNLYSLNLGGGPIDVTGSWNNAIGYQTVNISSTSSVNFNVPNFDNVNGGYSFSSYFSVDAGGSVQINAHAIQTYGITTSSGNLNIQLTGTLINDGLIGASEGVVYIQSPDIVNNGTISSKYANVFSNPGAINVSGPGYLVGNTFYFTYGPVSINQSGIIGNISGVSGGPVVIIGGTTLGTNGTVTVNGAVSASSSLPTGGQKGAELSNGSLVSVSLSNPVSSAVVSTDSQRRTLSFGSGQGGEDSLGTSSKLVVVNRTQALSVFVAGDSSMLIAEEGSEVSEEEGELFLHNGKVILNAVDGQRTIRTAQGSITVDKDSTVVVKVGEAGSLSAANLHGTSEVVFKGDPQVRMTLKTGDVVLDAPDGADGEELVAIDGIGPGQFIAAGIQRTGRKTTHTKVAVQEAITKDIMINGSLVHIAGASSKQHKSYVNNLKSDQKENTPLRPIAYASPVNNAVYVQHVTGITRLSPNQQSLLLFDRKAVVETNLGKIECAKNSIVFARATDGKVLHLMNFHGAVKASSTKHGTIRSVVPGQEIVLSDGTDPTFEDHLARRNLKKIRGVDGAKVHTSEFSIMSFFSAYPPISKVALKDSKLRDTMLKNCVAVQMSLKRGPYRSLDK